MELVKVHEELPAERFKDTKFLPTHIPKLEVYTEKKNKAVRTRKDIPSKKEKTTFNSKRMN